MMVCLQRQDIPISLDCILFFKMLKQNSEHYYKPQHANMPTPQLWGFNRRTDLQIWLYAFSCFWETCLKETSVATSRPHSFLALHLIHPPPPSDLNNPSDSHFVALMIFLFQLFCRVPVSPSSCYLLSHKTLYPSVPLLPCYPSPVFTVSYQYLKPPGFWLCNCVVHCPYHKGRCFLTICGHRIVIFSDKNFVREDLFIVDIVKECRHPVICLLVKNFIIEHFPLPLIKCNIFLERKMRTLIEDCCSSQSSSERRRH